MVLAWLLILLGCGGPPRPTEGPTIPTAVASTPAIAEQAPASFLANVLPASADMAIQIRDLSVWAGYAPKQHEEHRGALAEELAEIARIPSATAVTLVGAARAAGVAIEGIASGNGSFAVVLAFDDAAAVETLLAEGPFGPGKPLAGGTLRSLDRSKLPKPPRGDEDSTLARIHQHAPATIPTWWHARRKLLVAGQIRMVKRIAQVVDGDLPALEGSALLKRAPAPITGADIVVNADISSMFPKSPLRAVHWGTTIAEGRTTSALEVTMKPQRLPVDISRLAAMPIKQLSASVSADALAYAALSLKLAGNGKTQLLRIVDGLKEVLAESPEQVAATIGDKLAISASLAKNWSLDEDKPWKGVASNFQLEISQPAAWMRRLQAIVAKAKPKIEAAGGSVKKGRNGVVLIRRDKKGGPLFGARVLIKEKELRLSLGDDQQVKKSLLSGSAAIGSQPRHQSAMEGLTNQAQLLAWLDVSQIYDNLVPILVRKLGPEKSKLITESVSFEPGYSTGLTFSLDAQPGQWRLNASMVNGEAVVGALAAVGVYGVRRYLASAKTSEAKNMVGAIARGATAAYEMKGKLCKSAQPVPATVPAGKKYQPVLVAGADFETGDATTGWKCLRFGLTQPHYYQYSYTSDGKGYTATARGDLDGDGVESEFVLRGIIDPKTKNLRIQRIVITNEFE